MEGKIHTIPLRSKSYECHQLTLYLNKPESEPNQSFCCFLFQKEVSTIQIRKYNTNRKTVVSIIQYMVGFDEF